MEFPRLRMGFGIGYKSTSDRWTPIPAISLVLWRLLARNAGRVPQTRKDPKRLERTAAQGRETCP